MCERGGGGVIQMLMNRSPLNCHFKSQLFNGVFKVMVTEWEYFWWYMYATIPSIVLGICMPNMPAFVLRGRVE